MPDVSKPDFWENIYRRGKPGWDLGGPSPVFRRLLEEGAYPPGRIIVLGAGHGHDAFLFAQHGFEVTAVDFAEDAVRAMRERAGPDTSMTILQRDIFELSEQFEHAFDYVLEYTCFCAIDPRRRADYADLVARLIKPGGLFIALAFPVWKREGGPPFAVVPDEMIDLLTSRGFQLVHREMPADSPSPRQGLEELLILRLAPVPVPQDL